MDTFTLDSAEDVLLGHLARLAFEGGEHNLLMVSVDPVHMQFSASKGGGSVRLEAVASRHLPETRRLGDEDEALLVQAGFVLADDRSFYARDFAVEEPGALEDVAFIAIRMFVEIYGCRADEPVAFRSLLASAH